jgi:RNA polymerase sigma factor (sigma-70 family)
MAEIQDIRNNDQRKIEKIYYDHKDIFIAFAKKNYHVTTDTAHDIYHDTFLALHQNIQSGRLEILTVPLRTYLFQIGKNKICDHFKRTNNKVLLEKFPDLSSGTDAGDFDQISTGEDSAEDRKKLIIYNTVSQLASPCKEVLTYYYWDEKSMKEIAELMDYSSPDVAKTQKSKCLKKITAFITEKLKKEGLI